MKKGIIIQKREQGITLIALVITVIILLILAGVAINAAIGDNGLFKKSQEATNKNKVEIYKEALEMIKAETYIDVDNNSSTFLEKFKENFDTEIAKSSTSLKGATAEYLNQSKNALVIITEDGHKFLIQENGIEYKGNDESVIVKSAGNTVITPKEDYGKIVTGYNSKTEGLTWRLFYVDNVDPLDSSKDRIYLVSDIITTDQAPTKTVGTENYSVIQGQNEFCSKFHSSANSSDGVIAAYSHNEETNNIGNASKWLWDIDSSNHNIASKWLKQWYSYGSHRTEGNNTNMKAVAYMLDSSIWLESFGDAEEKCEYAIGGPTIEMFCESFKDTHPNEYLESRVNGDIGYEIRIVKENNASEWGYDVGYILETIGNDGIYKPGNENTPYGRWIASPAEFQDSGATATLVNTYDGSMGSRYPNHPRYGLSPIVCLKEGITLERDGDGFKIQ